MLADNTQHNPGIWPSPAEFLQAEYPEWDISRDLDSAGRHGNWVAQHTTDRDRVHSASDIPTLRKLLEKDAARRSRDDPAPRRDAGSCPDS